MQLYLLHGRCLDTAMIHPLHCNDVGIVNFAGVVFEFLYFVDKVSGISDALLLVSENYPPIPIILCSMSYIHCKFFFSIYSTLANNIQIAQGANLGQLQL